MKITEAHLQATRAILNPQGMPSGFAMIRPEAMDFCQDLLQQYIDQDALAWIHAALDHCLLAEFEWLTTPGSMSLSQSRDRDSLLISHMLLAILGPIYEANGKKLPTITYADIEAAIADPMVGTLATMEAVAEKYRQYHPHWFDLIRPYCPHLQRVVTRQFIWVVTEAFVRKLPDPL